MAFYEFPGSNFHDLNLDWLLQQMKNCLAEWASTKTDWQALAADNATFKATIEAEWDELKTFVNDYFANLDVSEEISEKINQMIADGSLLALIKTTVESSAASATTAWLAEHIAQETGYVIDDTLTVEGAAADSKAVGTAVSSAMKYTEDSTGRTIIPLVKGFYVKPVDGVLDVNNPVASANFSYGMIECSPGDWFTITGDSYQSSYPMAFYFTDNEYRIVLAAEANISITNKLVSAPAGSSYLFIHTRRPNIESFKGKPVSVSIADLWTEDDATQRSSVALEYGSISEQTGVNTQPNNTRIRSATYIPIDSVSKIFWDFAGLHVAIYVYSSSLEYLGYDNPGVITVYNPEYLYQTFPNAYYFRFILYNNSNPLTSLESVFETIKYNTRIKKNPYPRLSASRKSSIITLAEQYLSIAGNFTYNISATINNYASQSSAIQNGKFKICCSLLAMMIWAGRSAADFSNLNNYSNSITKAFSWGYYFSFPDRNCYNLHPETGYYGYRNPLESETYEGSYSYNTFYAPNSAIEAKQAYNQFMYANDMAKELVRLGYEIPMSEIQTGDLIFTSSAYLTPTTNTFNAIAYKHIDHVAIVLEKTSSGLVLIESSSLLPAAIATTAYNGTDEEKTRLQYLLSRTEVCARIPAAWGAAGNVPSVVAPR